MSARLIVLISFFIIYIIQCIFVYIRVDLRGSDKGLKIIMYLPIGSTLFICLAIIFNFIENIQMIKDRKKRLERELKDRDRKIKLGIIKINEIDPYGEEDWE
jgi:hypothetical protein